MTKNEIIAMSKEAGMAPHLGHTDDDGKHHPAVNALKTSVPVEWLERFAALVAASEREACAQVCEAEHVGADVCDDCDNDLDETYNRALRDGATAIRARGAA